MAFTSHFCTCFDGESQLRFTIRLSFKTELGSVVHHVLKAMFASDTTMEPVDSRKGSKTSQISTCDSDMPSQDSEPLQQVKVSDLKTVGGNVTVADEVKPPKPNGLPGSMSFDSTPKPSATPEPPAPLLRSADLQRPAYNTRNPPLDRLNNRESGPTGSSLSRNNIK